MAGLQPVDDAEIKKAGYEYNSSMNPTYISGRYNNLSKPRTAYYTNKLLNLPISVTPLLVLLLQVVNQAATFINTRYTFAVIPGWFYGTILWWSQHQDKFKPRFHCFWIGCIGLSILLTYTSNPHRALYFISPYSFQPWVYQSLPAQLGHAAHVKKY